MEFNLENKLDFYKLKIEKYREKIEELEGGAFYSGIKMIIYDSNKEKEVLDLIKNYNFTSDQLLNLLGKKAYIIEHSKNKVNLFRSKTSMSVCGLTKALKVIESKLKDGEYKTNFKKNIIEQLIELPDDEFIISTFLYDNTTYDNIMLNLKDKIPSTYTKYIVINFISKYNVKTKKQIYNNILYPTDIVQTKEQLPQKTQQQVVQQRIQEQAQEQQPVQEQQQD